MDGGQKALMILLALVVFALVAIVGQARRDISNLADNISAIQANLSGEGR